MASPRFARRLETFNVLIFIVFALSGYVQYFMHGSPPERSLSVGFAFSAILVLYLFLLRQRQKK